MVALLLIAALALPLPIVQVHTELVQDWNQQVEEVSFTLTPQLVEDWKVIHALESWSPPTPPVQVQVKYSAPPPPRAYTAGVEQWRTLVESYFQPADVPWALRVIGCESNGNPYAKNPTSTASGLWQHLRGWWSGAWGGTGAFDPFDPDQSMRAGAWLFYNGGASHWNASRGCWG